MDYWEAAGHVLNTTQITVVASLGKQCEHKPRRKQCDFRPGEMGQKRSISHIRIVDGGHCESRQTDWEREDCTLRRFSSQGDFEGFYFERHRKGEDFLHVVFSRPGSAGERERR